MKSIACDDVGMISSVDRRRPGGSEEEELHHEGRGNQLWLRYRTANRKQTSFKVELSIWELNFLDAKKESQK